MDREELFVPVAVHDDLCQQRRLHGGQRGPGVAGVEHVDREMLDAAAVLGEIRRHRITRLRPDEHHRHATGSDGTHARGFATGKWHQVEAEPVREGVDRTIEVVDGDHHVIDAGGHGVERGASTFRSRQLVRRRVRASAGDLDPMGFRQQHAEHLLGEVGIDATIDGPLPPAGDDVTHTVWLDDGRVAAFLHACHLLAHGEASGKHLHELLVEFIDPGTQFGKAGHGTEPSEPPLR